MMVKEGRVERFLLLPFSFGCDSQSSVAVATSAAVSSEYFKTGEKGSEQNLRRAEVKKNEGFWKASIFSQGFHRLIKGFKSFSQFFVYKEELEEENEMEIGFPTDVKHVTHIGLDGSTTVINPIPHSNWETLNPASSISLQQFQLAMPAQPQSQPLPQPQPQPHAN